MLVSLWNLQKQMTAISGLLDDTKYDATKSPAYTCSGDAILQKFRKWINSMMSQAYCRSTMRLQTEATPQIPPPGVKHNSGGRPSFP